MALDEREDDDEALAFGQLGKARLADHVLLALQAAVENHDHRRGIPVAEAIRHEHLVGSFARARLGPFRQVPAEERAGTRAVTERQDAEQNARPNVLPMLPSTADTAPAMLFRCRALVAC